MGDGPSVLVTLRMSARDRALLEQLVERERRELEDLGVEVSLSSVMRKLIRAAARASAIEVAAGDEVPRRAPPAAEVTPARPPPPSVTQDQVRALLKKKMAERRGLGAELARKLGVERAQVSRFKGGVEAFPVSKLSTLWTLLHEPAR
jgi:DNA-binding Xre family transcriptional regulator